METQEITTETDCILVTNIDEAICHGDIMNDEDDSTSNNYLIQDSDDGSKWSIRIYHWSDFETDTQDFIVVPLVFDEGGHFPTQKALDILYSPDTNQGTLSSWGTFWRRIIDTFLDNNWPLYEIDGDFYSGGVTFDDGKLSNPLNPIYILYGIIEGWGRLCFRQTSSVTGQRGNH